MIGQLKAKSESKPDAKTETLQETRPTLDALSGMRFVACLCVVMVHAECMKLIPTFADPRMECLLAQALPFFFTLSGFVLAYNYRSMGSWQTCSHYLINRAARVLPMYYITGLACLAIPTLVNLGARYHHLSYWFMVQDWFTENGLQHPLNSAAHSLSSELFYYLMFPLILSVGRLKSIAIILAMLGSIYYLDCNQIAELNFSLHPYTFSKFFLMGMLFTQVYEMLSARLKSIKQPLVFTAIEAISLFLAYWFSYKISNPPVEEALWHINGQVIAAVPILHQLQAVALAILITVIGLNRGFISKLLGTRFFAILGLSSYCLFLIHYPIETMLQTSTTDLSMAEKIPLATGAILAMIAGSYLLLRHCEEPLRKLIIKTYTTKVTLRQALRASLRLLLPLAAIWLIAPTLTTINSISKLLSKSTAEQIWQSCHPQIIPGTDTVSYGGGDKLLGARLVRKDVGLYSLESLWKVEKSLPDRGYIALHLIDEKGNILLNLDHKIAPPDGFLTDTWLDSVLIPVAKFPKATALAMGIYRDGRGLLENIKAPNSPVLYGKMLIIPVTQPANEIQK